ncbi:DUF6893 family small protein [Kitasatospora sp. NPDC057015]
MRKILIAGVAGFVTLLVVVSLPDIKRYLKIRCM